MIASSIPAAESKPPRRARPPTPQRTVSGSPPSRANAIATEYATTPPAASAAPAPAGPARKTALQFIVADSTKIEQNVRNAGSARAPRGRAKRADSTAASSAPGRRRGITSTATPTTPTATAGNSTLGPAPAAAATAAIADPVSSPKLHAAVQPGEQRPSHPILERDPVRVRRDVGEADARAEHAGRENERPQPRARTRRASGPARRRAARAAPARGCRGATSASRRAAATASRRSRRRR